MGIARRRLSSLIPLPKGYEPHPLGWHKLHSPSSSLRLSIHLMKSMICDNHD